MSFIYLFIYLVLLLLVGCVEGVSGGFLGVGGGGGGLSLIHI